MATIPQGHNIKNIREKNTDVLYDAELAQKSAFLAQKTEKLTSALYKVTDFINDSEPLKWELRRAAIELLVAMMPHEGSNGETALFRTLATEKVVTLLNVSFIGSYVSKMNFSILRNEYESLKGMLNTVHRPSLVQENLTVSEEELKTRALRQEEHIGHLIKDIYKGHSVDSHKGHHVTSKRQLDSNQKRNTRSLVTDAERGRRRADIVGFIKDNNGANIKDIIKNLSVAKNISPKTVQRELAAMVSDGVLEKRGERRWSTYSVRN